MKLVLMASAMSAALLGLIAAQTVAPPAFEVASIKPDDTGGNYIDVKPGYLTAHGATPATCIEWAYRVQSSQVSGANSAVSDLLQSARYSMLRRRLVRCPRVNSGSCYRRSWPNVSNLPSTGRAGKLLSWHW
jgi:hypothetical protein